MRTINDLQHELQEAYAGGYIRYLYSTMYPDPTAEDDVCIRLKKITVIFKQEIKIALIEEICNHIKTKYNHIVSGVYRDPMTADHKIYIQLIHTEGSGL